MELNVHSATLKSLTEDTKSFVLVDFHAYGSALSDIARGTSPIFDFAVTYEMEMDDFFSHALAKGEFVRIEIYTFQKETATPRLFAHASVSTSAILHPSVAIHLPRLEPLPAKDEGMVGSLSVSMQLAQPIPVPD